MKIKYLLVAGILLSVSAFAQTNSQSIAAEPTSDTPIFRVNVISRSVTAVNYRHRSGSTKLDFAGTELMPSASGEAKVESERGSIKIRAEFGELQSPQSFGNEYLTYVLWAISPEGRAVNLGEVLVGDNSRSKLEVTTDLQAFALIVTAEPYYAVRQPSDVIVLQNIVRDDTKGTTESVNANYELMQRGGYIPTGYKFDPVVLNTRLPLEFFEARNALRIAQSEGAETYAGDSYMHAVQLMSKVDEYAISTHIERKQLIAVAREEVQTAEDARAIAVKKMDELRLANEQQASADAQARSRAQADDAILQENKARIDTAAAEAAKSRAESDAMDAQAAKSQAQSDAATARDQASDAEAGKAQAETDAMNSQAANSQAQSDAAIARKNASDAQAATAQANTDLANTQAASATALSAAQADADSSRLAAQQAQLGVNRRKLTRPLCAPSSPCS